MCLLHGATRPAQGSLYAARPDRAHLASMDEPLVRPPGPGTTTIIATDSAGRLSPVTGVDVHHMGGAFGRVPEDATAFPNRSALRAYGPDKLARG